MRCGFGVRRSDEFEVDAPRCDSEVKTQASGVREHQRHEAGLQAEAQAASRVLAEPQQHKAGAEQDSAEADRAIQSVDYRERAERDDGDQCPAEPPALVRASGNLEESGFIKSHAATSTRPQSLERALAALSPRR